MITALGSATSSSSGLPVISSSLPSLKGAAAPTPSESKEPFGDLLKDAIGQADRLEQQAHDAVTGLMTGTGVDVHQAMIASEKASMAFEMVLAVRNKAIQSYQSVMNMQF